MCWSGEIGRTAPFQVFGSMHAFDESPSRSRGPWPVRETGLGRPRVVLAAVDVADESDADIGRSVLRAGQTLASRGAEAGAALHVVHAWSFLGESILSCPLRGLPARRLRSLAAKVAEQRRRQVDELCAGALDAAPAGVFVQRGDPRTVIPTLARRLRADLVVLGHPQHARGGLGLGGVTQSLLGRLGCDLLVVRAPSTPPGSRGAAPGRSSTRARWRRS